MLFRSTFNSIIAALLTKKCDAIISGMNDTAERRKQVDFVDYLKVGQAITVKKGNPEHFSTLASLSGKRVSVESGTTNRGFLVASDGAAPAKAYLRSRWAEIRRSAPTAPDLTTAIDGRYDAPIPVDDVPTLTDDYAPTDALLVQ